MSEARPESRGHSTAEWRHRPEAQKTVHLDSAVAQPAKVMQPARVRPLREQYQPDLAAKHLVKRPMVRSRSSPGRRWRATARHAPGSGRSARAAAGQAESSPLAHRESHRELDSPKRSQSVGFDTRAPESAGSPPSSRSRLSQAESCASHSRRSQSKRVSCQSLHRRHRRGHPADCCGLSTAVARTR